MKTSILVLSDIHFGRDAATPEFNVENVAPEHHIENYPDMKAGLIERLKERDLDFLVISGDLTSIGSPAEYLGCRAVVEEIRHELDISEDGLVLCHGNHDVDWAISEMSKKTEDSGYKKIAATTAGLFFPQPEPDDAGPTFGAGVYIRDNCIFYVLNSGSFCSSDQEYRHGKLGLDQVAWLKETLQKYETEDKWHILLIHHHVHSYSYPVPIPDISLVEEQAELMEIIGDSSIQLVIHGHRHHPKLETIGKDNWRFPKTFLCAGSLSVNHTQRQLGQIMNAFHVLELDRRLENGAALGKLWSYQHTPDGWTPAENKSTFPVDPERWFGVNCDADTRDKIVRDLIMTSVNASQESFVALPKYESLVEELRCRSLKELNECANRVAATCGVRVVGKYPEDVVVQRK